jgi:hypothetical protein
MCMSEDRSNFWIGLLLRWVLPAALGLGCAVRLATWAPHYLTWPWFTDSDVFGTLAYGWHLGLRPYRDLYGNNFPGTIYLFWFAGRICGWGKTWPIYAADLVLLAALLATLLAWSRRRAGSFLPGLVGTSAILSYVCGLDYTMSAQRDWQAPLLATVALLLIQGWRGRLSLLFSALAFAAALTVRPQALAFLPALLAALAIDTPAEGRKAKLTIWGACVGGGLVIGFAPLVLAGVFGDFVRSLGVVVYGGSYNDVTSAGALSIFFSQLGPPKMWILAAGIAIVAARVGASGWRDAAPWLLAWLGVLFYGPLSPQPLPYLTHPLQLIVTVLATVLTGLVLAQTERPTPLGPVTVLLIVALTTQVVPLRCSLSRSVQAVRDLRRGGEPAAAPVGYTTSFFDVPMYRWRDYRAMLHYLRTEVSPRTRVANMVFLHAVTGPTGRLPAFPAESISWVHLVNKRDEGRFARAMERTQDAVAVLDASPQGLRDFDEFPRLKAALFRFYRPEARFGPLAVWRHIRPSGSPGSLQDPPKPHP